MNQPISRLLRLCAAAGAPLALAAAPDLPASPASNPDPDSTAVYAAAAGRARALVEAHRRHLDVPGMQVAVAIDGKVVWSEGFGYADLEQRTPVTPLTRFRIGSVSKTLTAAGLGVLLDRGAIELDAAVQRYVPAFPQKPWPLTVRHLAAQQSGIRHYTSNADVDRTEHYASVTDALAIFAADSLRFEPGTRYGYSSYAYVLLSAAMEAAAGQPFIPFMQQNVFGPLGMRSTGPDEVDSIVPHRSRFYVPRQDGGRVNAFYVDNSYKWAAGGLLSTAEDLVRFGSAHLQPGFLSAATLALLWTPQRTRDGVETEVGISWEPHTTLTGRQAMAFSGNLPSGRAVLAVYPRERLVIAVLANTGEQVYWNERETFGVAEQFLAAPDTAGAVDPRGVYTFETVVSGDTRRGTLQIVRGEHGYAGTLTFPPFAPAPMPLVDVRGDEARGFAIVGSWMDVRIRFSGGAPASGTWALSRSSGTLDNLTRIR
ncbi:MAG TPA: serine hydrolase domain-containing protein [Longimicrobium sp.]|nr:serine hydrolase domain-containing protein [Longimicrobium sp.]